MHLDPTDELLAQEVPDLDQRSALGDGAIDREMGVHGAHLVLVALEKEKSIIFFRYVFLFLLIILIT